jgi:Pyruvate kinase, barrel domain
MECERLIRLQLRLMAAVGRSCHVVAGGVMAIEHGVWERNRAEATDVANAVLDGVDGILLGAETLRGKYPVETVRTILDICRQAEKVFDHASHFDHLVQVLPCLLPLLRLFFSPFPFFPSPALPRNPSR